MMNNNKLKEIYDANPDDWIVYAYNTNRTHLYWFKDNVGNKQIWFDYIIYKLIAKKDELIADAVIANPDVEVEFWSYSRDSNWKTIQKNSFFEIYDSAMHYKVVCTKVNLCDTCCLSFATCKPDSIKFGNGIGNDNVYRCSSYRLKETKPVNFNGGYIKASQEAYDLLIANNISVEDVYEDDGVEWYFWIKKGHAHYVEEGSPTYLKFIQTDKQFYINNRELSWNEPEEFDGFDFKNTFEEISGGETLDEFCKQENKASLDEPNPKPLWHVDFGNNKQEDCLTEDEAKEQYDKLLSDEEMLNNLTPEEWKEISDSAIASLEEDLFDLEDTIPMTDEEYEEYEITGKVPSSAITRNILETQRIKPTISKMEIVQNFNDGYKKGWKDRDKQSDLEDKTKPTQINSTGNDNSKVDITRIEIIGTEGREFSSRLVSGKYEMNIQDEGRTLKLFEISTKKQWYENPENFPALIMQEYKKELHTVNSKEILEQVYLNLDNGYRLATKDEVMSLYWKEK